MLFFTLFLFCLFYTISIEKKLLGKYVIKEEEKFNFDYSLIQNNNNSFYIGSFYSIYNISLSEDEIKCTKINTNNKKNISLIQVITQENINPFVTYYNNNGDYLEIKLYLNNNIYDITPNFNDK